MNALGSMITGPLMQAVGWALLHLLWQGLLVAAILATVLALLQRQSANARYLACCGALLLLVALGVATAYRAYQPDLAIAATSTSPVVESPLGIASFQITTQPAEPEPITAMIFSFVAAHLSQIVALWLAGVLILSIRLVAGWIGVHRLTTRRSHLAGHEWDQALRRIAGALNVRRRIRLLESAAVEVPTVVGWLRPIILLPIASLSGLSIQQIEMILAHELGHIRRHDFIVNLTQSVVETLLFYHPAVWWISKRIRVEREHCCDDLAVAVCGDPVQYARALTRFEELRVDARSVLGANGGSLIDRIRRLVLAGAESANWPSRWAAGAALLTVLAAITIAPSLPLFASHDEQAPPPPPALPAAKAAPVPAPAPPLPATTPKLAVKCDAPPAPPEAVIDVDAPEVSASIAATPAPIAVVSPRIALRPMIAPMVNESMSLAEAVASGVLAGVEGGVMGGVMGGIEGGVNVKRHRIGEGGKLSVDDLIILSSTGVTSKYIEEMRGAGLEGLSLDDIVSLRVQGVTPSYIRGMRDAGFKIGSAKNVISLRIQGVTPEYVKGMAGAGYTNLSTRELIELRIQGVTPAFVKSLAEAGYANLSVKDLVRLHASGVSADFIRELSKYRTK